MSDTPGSAMPTAIAPDPSTRPAASVRDDLRNVAIVAHVDHGKTTLVDAMLRQTGAFRDEPGRRRPGDGLGRPRAREGHHDPRQADDDRRRRRPAEHRRHARPRRLRRRGRAQPADGRQRPAAGRRRRGPAAADPLRAPEGDGPPAAGRRRAQQDRPLGRPRRRRSSTTSTSCSSTSAPTSTRSSSRSSTRTPSSARRPATWPCRAPTSGRSSTCSSTSRRRPVFEPGPPAPAPGHQPVGERVRGPHGRRADPQRDHPRRPAHRRRPRGGRRHRGRDRARPHDHVHRAPSRSLQTAHGMERIDIAEAGPGEIVSVAGLPEVTIGDTLTEPGDPRPLPRLDVDAPTLSMTFGVNTSPLGGRDGKYVTSRQIKARLEKEVLGNVSIEVHPTESGDTFEVRGPRRAPARRPDRADAARGLRAHREPARGDPRTTSAARPRSRTSGSRSTSRPTTSARSSRRSPAARAAWSR